MSPPETAPPARSSAASSSPPHAAPLPRRGFLAKLAAGTVGAIAALVPLGLSLFALFDPLRNRRGKRAANVEGGARDGFYRVTSLAALPADGVPRFFRIIADRDDAWTHFAEEPVGSIFLRRTGEDVVQAYSARCPHAACFVSWVAAQAEYLCPCHNSLFSVTGERSATSPSPRDLDELEVAVRDDAVWVKYENFRTGTSERIPA
ncbi:MAG: Rieske 2Fe-2S domain-containing protein [Planctomycetales bacterium]